MKTEKFIDPAEALDRLKVLSEGDNTIEVYKTDDGLYQLSWLENVKYTSLTGEEHTDEVWTKEDGTMLAVQNIDLSHAQNIIRMLLRNERARNMVDSLAIDQLETLLNSAEDVISTVVNDSKRVLH